MARVTEGFAGTKGEEDDYWMGRALDQARLGLGATSPNPPVGAVIVRDGHLLAKGHHAQAGGLHAEVSALQALSDPRQAIGASIYVTLEPCSTQGRTPPCTEALIEAGIARVVYGSVDPNPAHVGRAQALLQSEGIEVTSGVRATETDYLIRLFQHWIRRGTPYVIAKAGLSLDGRLARPPAESTWLTSPASRRDAQSLRRLVDAILVGAETIRVDDPSLMCRDPTTPPNKRPLKRFILSRSKDLPKTAQVFTDDWAAYTHVLEEQSWPDRLKLLAEQGITSLLIEGGGEVLGDALQAGVVNEVCFYIAPRLCGGPVGIRVPSGNVKAPIPLDGMRVERIGDDLKLSGYPQKISS